MLINLDSNTSQLKPIVFILANYKYHLEPELYEGPVLDHISFRLSPSSLLRKENTTPKSPIKKHLNIANPTNVSGGSG